MMKTIHRVLIALVFAVTLPAQAAGSGIVEKLFIQQGAGAQAEAVHVVGRDYYVAQFATPAQAVVAAAGKRLYVQNNESVTLNVPAQFATIQAALDAVQGWVISASGTVTIQVADGTYTHTANVTVNHPYGARLRLVGNETTPANCIIQVATPGFDAFAVTGGHTLGYMNGFKIYKTAKAPFSDNSTGILAHNGAKIILGNKILVDNWYYGIAARNGSYISATYASVDHAGDVGIWAMVGSTVDASYATSNNASDVSNGWGFGMQAEFGSALNASGATASGNLVGGIASLSNSNVRALSATASNNTGSGFFARDGGTIEAHGSTASNNTRYGVEEIGVSRIIGNSMTMTANTIGATKPTAYFDNDTLGARIAANGDFRLDVNGANSWYFNSSGGLQFAVGHAASAVNHLATTGSAAGQTLHLFASGSDANVAVNVESKGGEVVRLNSNGKTALQAYNSSSSNTDYMQVDGGVGTTTLSAQGGTNVTAKVIGKGSSGVMIENVTTRPVGFFGSSGTTKQTISGSRGSNAALAALLTALAAHGIVVDSTTP